jgi:hypothetical protein
MDESMKLVESDVGTPPDRDNLLRSLNENYEELWFFVHNLLQDVERVGVEIARYRTDMHIEKGIRQHSAHSSELQR